MKCKKCGTEMKQCKNGVIVGSLNEGIKLSLYECPKCGYLKRKKEKVKF
ncbi:MAG: hypothetical protein KAW92_06990 [Candidatus Cloacimonetes bacterium]|nr:hypothetical protein [Candidatus Cloacimonadota bacterium]